MRLARAEGLLHALPGQVVVVSEDQGTLFGHVERRVEVSVEARPRFAEAVLADGACFRVQGEADDFVGDFGDEEEVSVGEHLERVESVDDLHRLQQVALLAVHVPHFQALVHGARVQLGRGPVFDQLDRPDQSQVAFQKAFHVRTRPNGHPRLSQISGRGRRSDPLLMLFEAKSKMKIRKSSQPQPKSREQSELISRLNRR